MPTYDSDAKRVFGQLDRLEAERRLEAAKEIAREVDDIIKIPDADRVAQIAAILSKHLPHLRAG